MQSIRILLVLLLCSCITTTAHAFGKEGHRIVAGIAFSQLTPATHKALKELLGSQYRLEWVASSNWAALQSERYGKEWMKKLHYVWFDTGAERFEPNVNCENNQCVVAAILESEKVLKESKQFSLVQRRQAVKYLLHYVADIHQPTNCGFRRDQGGRKIWLKTADDKEVNLHWIWENGILASHAAKWSTVSGELSQDISDEDVQEWTATMDPAEWAWECHKTARSTAYKFALEADWGPEYYKEAWPVYEKQMKIAGVRLAALLNTLFTPAAE